MFKLHWFRAPVVLLIHVDLLFPRSTKNFTMFSLQNITIFGLLLCSFSRRHLCKSTQQNKHTVNNRYNNSRSFSYLHDNSLGDQFGAPGGYYVHFLRKTQRQLKRLKPTAERKGKTTRILRHPASSSAVASKKTCKITAFSMVFLYMWSSSMKFVCVVFEIFISLSSCCNINTLKKNSKLAFYCTFQ